MQPSDNQNHKLPQVNSSDDPGDDNSFAAQPTVQNDSLASQQNVVVGTQNTSQSSMVSDEITAEDLDLIEKAWVEKAKEIVSNTQGNPYKQNVELNRIRTEYIKKRYNKSVGTDE